jgi:phytoene dehydrogenase-like protein
MYDLIVIGDDLSSHVAAAYASHNGLNTLLIAESGLGGLQLIDDFIFNLDSTPFTGLGPEQLGCSILTDLGIGPPETEGTSINPAYQIILPEHRIDFYNNPSTLKAELVREFPAWDEGISDYYDAVSSASNVFQDWMVQHPKIQPQNLKEYFSYLKIFPHIVRYKFGAVRFDKILSQNTSLEKVWEAQQAMLSFNNEDLFSFASAFQYCAPLRGVSYFPQGKQFLFNALIEKVESTKGLYLNNYQVSSITKNKIIELEIKPKDGTISKVSGHNLIVSTKSSSLSLIRENNKPVNFSEWFRPAKIAYFPYTIFLGVAQRCLPEQFARHIAVVTDVNRDIHDNNLIILETSLPEKDNKVSQAKASLSATVFLPDIEKYWTGDSLKHQANSILDRLEVFLPFLKENIELFNVETSINISMDYRKVLSPKYKVRNAFFTSFAAKSNKTRFGNIFLTGASLLIDAGFDAEIISGKNAAFDVLKKRK